MKAFFHVSRFVMSGILSERTLTWQTTPTFEGSLWASWAASPGAQQTRIARQRMREGMEWAPVRMIPPLVKSSSLSGPAPVRESATFPVSIIALFFGEEREEPAGFLGGWPAAVLADLESLGKADLDPLLLAVGALQLRAKPRGGFGEVADELLAHLHLPCRDRRGILRIGHELRAAVAASLVELRFERIHRSQLLLNDPVDRHGDVRRERIGPAELVLGVQKHRILLEVGSIGAEERHGDHVGRVHDEDADVAVVGMIVVGPVADHDIGFPLADETADRPP